MSIVDPEQFRLLAALLDHEMPPWRAGTMPPLGHWLLFPPDARQSALGADGHPARADDGLPRRMWAGSRVRFLAPVPLGAEVTQHVDEGAAVEKQGRSGRMRFVTLTKQVRIGDRVVIEEDQDLVYREAAIPGASARPAAPAETLPAPADARTLTLDPVALFRFSALTFNAHRIHYDRDYAMQAEGYPALVVHGPFIATLLMDHWLRANPGAAPSRFAFKAMRPVFDGELLIVGSEGDRLLAIDAGGGLAMEASVR